MCVCEREREREREMVSLVSTLCEHSYAQYVMLFVVLG